MTVRSLACIRVCGVKTLKGASHIESDAGHGYDRLPKILKKSNIKPGSQSLRLASSFLCVLLFRANR